MPKGPGSPKTRHHQEAPEFQALSKILAARIRKLRAERKWTIEQAAEAIQVEPSHLKRLEAGTGNPTLALLISMAKAFRVSLTELLETT